MQPCSAVKAQLDAEQEQFRKTRTFPLSNLVCGIWSRVLDDGGYQHRCVSGPGHSLPHSCTDPCPREFSGKEEADG